MNEALLNTETVPLVQFVTYTLLLYVFAQAPKGPVPAPIEMVVKTVSLVPSMTLTLLVSEFSTYILFVLGFTPTPRSFVPTTTVVLRVSVAPSITETLPLPALGT
jgi:hypothetical protein